MPPMIAGSGRQVVADADGVVFAGNAQYLEPIQILVTACDVLAGSNADGSVVVTSSCSTAVRPNRRHCWQRLVLLECAHCTQWQC